MDSEGGTRWAFLSYLAPAGCATSDFLYEETEADPGGKLAMGIDLGKFTCGPSGFFLLFP